MTEANTGGAAGGDPFYSSYGLGDNERAFIAGKGFSDPASMVKSHMEADKLLRERNVIRAPDLAKLDDWEGWEMLGWTKERDKYVVDPFKPPEGRNYDLEFEKTFVDLAHENHLSKAQAQAMRDKLVAAIYGAEDRRNAAAAAQSEQLKAALKSEWGADYDKRADRARQAAKAYGIGLEDAAELEKVLGAPRLARLLDRLGEGLSEGTLKGGAGGDRMTADGARAELARMEADPAFIKAMMNPRHPMFGQYNHKRNELIDAIHGKR